MQMGLEILPLGLGDWRSAGTEHKAIEAIEQLPTSIYKRATVQSVSTAKMPLRGAGAKTTRWI